jgi:hypothetical protein
MDNLFEFSIGSEHQTPTDPELPKNRMVHSTRVQHSGDEQYKYGYVNDLTPCNECKAAIHGF